MRLAIDIIEEIILLENASGQDRIFFFEGLLGIFQHIHGFLVHRQDPRDIQQFLGKGRFRIDNIFGDAFGDIPDPLEVGIDLQHGQQEAQVDGDRAEQGKDVLAVAVDLQFAAVDPFFFR